MKALFLLLILSLAAFAARGQSEHFTLAECGNDTLKYIEWNYEDNYERYVGQTVDSLLQECQLRLGRIVPDIFVLAEGGSDPREGKVIGVFFKFYQDEFEYTILLSFSPPYTYSKEDFRQYESYGDAKKLPVWNEYFHYFFKDYTIERIRIYKQQFGMPIKNYRRP